MSECVKSRYWRVRVNADVEWMSLLPMSAEVWRVREASVESKVLVCVVRYLNPVSERALKKLPLVSYRVWRKDGRELGDKVKYQKLKSQEAKYVEFFMKFRARTKCNL